MRITLAILAAALLFAPGCAYAPPENPNLVPPPVSPADLADRGIFLSSSSGSHSILYTGGYRSGLGRLMWRQFSDWQASPDVPIAGGKPIFDPVFGLEEGGLGKRKVDEYVWRPDLVRIRTSFENGLRAETICGYLGIDSVYAQVKLVNKGDAPLTVKLLGRVSEHVHSTLEPSREEPRRLAIDFHARLPELWKVKPSDVRRRFELRCSEGPIRVAGPRVYELALNVPAGGSRFVAMTLTDGYDPAPAEKFWDSPDKLPTAGTRAVQEWLNECRVPRNAVLDPRILKMAGNAWFQFWYNTEHPEGLWKSDIMSPSKSCYGRGIWLWDSAFHVLSLVTGGPEAVRLGESQVLAMVRSAHEDGHLPREVWVGAKNPDVQAPGVLTWAAMEVYKRNGNKAFLEEIYPIFSANNRWFYKTRDSNNNGLAEWNQTDSGWDTSPRWDPVREGDRLIPVDAVDLNCWLKLDQDLLAGMAEVLGFKDEAAEWRARAETSAKTIQEKMWNEKDAFFYDLDPRTEEQTGVQSPATYWALLARVATPEQAKRMVKHISDPKILGTAWPMPCVSVSNKSFDPKNYWRGPVWINLNWITIIGLERYGFREEAKRLRRRSIELILRDPTPREYYNPLTGEGLGAHNYTWTGALFIVMLQEEAEPK